MGNSNKYEESNRIRITERDRQLEQFRGTFESIIKKTSLNESAIEHIVRADLVEIVRMLNRRQVTSEQLVAVFGFRAATIGKDLCMITQHNFDFALKKARQCDQLRARSGKANFTMEDQWNESKHLPILFGVPTSIKDNVEMEGTVATVGLSARANRINKADSPMIRCIKNSGMIPFIKTNIPQLAFNFDSNNPLWGRALNPWNKNKSVGGSSGGEGAVLAGGVSPIGIGNDMGGSVRIPSHFCGVSGLMPSAHRLPVMGCFTKYSTAFSGKDTITGVSGPIGKSIDSLALWMSVMTTEQYYAGYSDPYIKLIPFDLKLYKQAQNPQKKLRIGYFKHLEMIQCSPACARALEETVQYLKSERYDLVQIKIPNEQETICSMFGELVGEGDFKAFTDMLEGEKLVDEYKNTETITQLNCCMFGVVQCLMNSTQPRMGVLVNASRKLSTYQYLRVVGRIKELREEWINFWREQKLDFVVCPAFGMEAPNHGTSNEGSLLAAYTFIWNLLAMTVATTPVTVVREDEQRYDSVWDDDITKCIKKTVNDSAGLPVGVQVVGIPFQEELVLGLTKKIESHFKFYQKHPLPINPKSK